MSQCVLVSCQFRKTSGFLLSSHTGIRGTAWKRSFKTETTEISKLKSTYDVVVVGAGHNGLVSAAYLQKAGYDVCVLERRNVIGGAAVTEEIIPGFKFSRASYLLSLLRPHIIEDLKLKEHGLKFYLREPYSAYTPILESFWSEFPAKSLLLSSSDMRLSQKEIAKFSTLDARNYAKYENEMSKFVKALNHLLDRRPPNLNGRSSLFTVDGLLDLAHALKALSGIGTSLPAFQELLTAPASRILNKWFESEPLKGTLVTDAVIGAMHGPKTPGNGYVLLHHVMGGVEGRRGAWTYPEGGMGRVSDAIGSSAMSLGAHIFTGTEVSKILIESVGKSTRATGVITKSGKEIKATKAVFSGTTPHVTFNQLMTPDLDPQVREILGPEFIQSINNIDYTSPVTKINVAVDRLPNFVANSKSGLGDWHKCSIHLNCERMDKITEAFESSRQLGIPSERPMIEMVIPSSLDPTLAPPGAHVCLLFTQYTPMNPVNGFWSDPTYKEAYAQKVFNVVEEYAPGFKKSIVGTDILSPWDLEKTFNLTGGNIFHGSMGLDQIYFLRPILTSKCSFPATPLDGLYLCGSGCHPGGGVMGVPGYIAAKTLIAQKP